MEGVSAVSSVKERAVTCIALSAALPEIATGPGAEAEGLKSAGTDRVAVRNIVTKQKNITVKVISLITVLFVIIISSSGSPRKPFSFLSVYTMKY